MLDNFGCFYSLRRKIIFIYRVKLGIQLNKLNFLKLNILRIFSSSYLISSSIFNERYKVLYLLCIYYIVDKK